jgi:aminopeptidase N
LQEGVNNIAVYYTNLYNNDGLGCLSFIDDSTDPPLDYTYTQFEPYSAHRFFPCFDQPDLKAVASFNIILPTDWVAVANNNYSFFGPYTQTDYIANAPYQNLDLLVGEYLNGQSGNFYVFKPTASLPTYLYCIIAGNYSSVVATADQLWNNIPMTVYSIGSYSSGLNTMAPFIFEITKLSLQLFETKFNVPYQFPKYDTVFCH